MYVGRPHGRQFIRPGCIVKGRLRECGAGFVVGTPSLDDRKSPFVIRRLSCPMFPFLGFKSSLSHRQAGLYPDRR